MLLICPECGYRFRVPEDERHDHPCPRCGYHPENGDEAVRDQRDKELRQAIVDGDYSAWREYWDTLAEVSEAEFLRWSAERRSAALTEGGWSADPA